MGCARNRWLWLPKVLLPLLAGLAGLPAAAAAGGRTPDGIFRRTAGSYSRTLTLEERSTATEVTRRVAFLNHRGKAVAEAYYRRPMRLADNYHILLTYVGRGTGAKILEIIPPQSDRVLVAIQYPFQSPRGALRWLRLPGRLRRMGYRTVAAGLLAMEFLAEEGLDPQRVIAVGASYGAAFATIHGALEPRVAQVAIIHGGGDFRTIFRHHLRRHRRGWLARPFLGVAVAVTAPFEPVRYAARISPRPFTVIGDLSDEIFPPASVLALFAAAREPKQLLWTDTGHVRSRADAVSATLIELASKALLAPPAADSSAAK